MDKIRETFAEREGRLTGPTQCRSARQGLLSASDDRLAKPSAKLAGPLLAARVVPSIVAVMFKRVF